MRNATDYDPRDYDPGFTVRNETGLEIRSYPCIDCGGSTKGAKRPCRQLSPLRCTPCDAKAGR